MKRVRFSFVSALFASMLLSALLGPAQANTQENAVVALHARSAPTKGVCTVGQGAPNIPCSSYTDTRPTLSLSYVYLVVAKADSAEGIRGLSCGIEYNDTPGTGLAVLSWVQCSSGLSVTGPTWPASGNGIRVTWLSSNCQRTRVGSDGVHAIAGAFYMYAYSGPLEFAITANQSVTTPELRVADCTGAESFDIPEALAGRVFFTNTPVANPGYNPCTDCTPLVCVTSSMVGTDVRVPDPGNAALTVDNCSGFDETIAGTWLIDGTPSGSFGSVIPAGGSALYNLPVPCAAIGTVEVTAQFSAAIGAGTSCMVSGFSEQVDVACTTPSPIITSILDVGNDQGRYVRINFERANLDRAITPQPILEYEAFRRILPFPLGTPEGVITTAAPIPVTTQSSALLANWEFVGSVPAHGELEYNMVVPTVGDSTTANGMYWSAYFIRATTAAPTTFYDSAPDSGYSKDNLAPSAPLGFTFFAPGRLRWNHARELDFDYFSVYGSPNNVFDGSALLIDSVTATSLNVQLNSHQYYHVTATDFGGNESPAATVFNTVAVLPEPEFIPTVYGLKQSQPNPFRTTTAISFDLPQPEGSVRLRVFDISGTLVKTLVDGPLGAGRYNISWQGKDEYGRSVSPGIYFYRIDASAFQKTGKAVRIQ